MPEPPVLRVVRGTPTDEDLAAVVAVLAARVGRAGLAEPTQSPSRWADPATRLGLPPYPGPGAWRRSGLPG